NGAYTANTGAATCANARACANAAAGATAATAGVITSDPMVHRDGNGRSKRVERKSQHRKRGFCRGSCFRRRYPAQDRQLGPAAVMEQPLRGHGGLRHKNVALYRG